MFTPGSVYYCPRCRTNRAAFVTTRGRDHVFSCRSGCVLRQMECSHTIPVTTPPQGPPGTAAPFVISDALRYRLGPRPRKSRGVGTPRTWTPTSALLQAVG